MKREVSITTSLILAGHEGLGNVINHVSVIEVPDAQEWLRGNELFLTAFYTIQNDIQAQLNLLTHLRRASGSGKWEGSRSVIGILS